MTDNNIVILLLVKIVAVKSFVNRFNSWIYLCAQYNFYVCRNKMQY